MDRFGHHCIHCIIAEGVGFVSGHRFSDDVKRTRRKRLQALGVNVDSQTNRERLRLFLAFDQEASKLLQRRCSLPIFLKLRACQIDQGVGLAYRFFDPE